MGHKSEAAEIEASGSKRDALMALGERVRPLSMAREQLLPVVTPLASLLAEGGLIRGTSIAVGGLAATSLAIALAAGASAAGSWVAVVGLDRFGWEAAEALGLALERVVAIDQVADPRLWATTVAALAEGFDVVLAGPPPMVRPAEGRRLAARLRERGSVLVLVGWPAARWGDRPEVELESRVLGWEGIGAGHGYLAARQVEISATGRRSASRVRRGRFWLPAADGRFLTVAEPSNVVPLPSRDARQPDGLSSAM